MRIWHEKLIPHLCQKHLCAMWREGLGAYKIITENKQGYKNHPAIKEFTYDPSKLWRRLYLVRSEMLHRGYHPKDMPDLYQSKFFNSFEWQTLDEQIQIIKDKKCKCTIV